MTMSANSRAMQTGVGVPAIRDIGADDVKAALREGWSDFTANPTHWAFLGLIYPIVGLLLAFAFSGASLLPLIFPLATGFALLGPFAAIGIYEISKRREAGLDPTWDDARKVFESPAMSAIAAMGGILLAIFVLWLIVAYAIFSMTLGDTPIASVSDLLHAVFASSKGWALLIVGNAVGFVFAVAVLIIGAVSFPLLLDRPQTSVGTAIKTSIEVFRVNPKSMGVWGIIVAALLVAGTIPFFVGLAIVMPLLGHATWHLYRKVIA